MRKKEKKENNLALREKTSDHQNIIFQKRNKKNREEAKAV